MIRLQRMNPPMAADERLLWQMRCTLLMAHHQRRLDRLTGKIPDARTEEEEIKDIRKIIEEVRA